MSEREVVLGIRGYHDDVISENENEGGGRRIGGGRWEDEDDDVIKDGDEMIGVWCEVANVDPSILFIKMTSSPSSLLDADDDVGDVMTSSLSTTKWHTTPFQPQEDDEDEMTSSSSWYSSPPHTFISLTSPSKHRDVIMDVDEDDVDDVIEEDVDGDGDGDGDDVIWELG